MANHINLIKQIACKNPLQDLIQAYDRQKADPRHGKVAPQYQTQYGYEIIDIRQIIMQLNLLKFTIHRIYIQASDSEHLSEVGWVVDSTCAYCLSCCKDLDVFSGKHHCRACGDRICGSCKLELMVKSLEKLGPVIVCLQCYRINRTTEGRGDFNMVVPLRPNITIGQTVLNGGSGPAGGLTNTMHSISSLNLGSSSPGAGGAGSTTPTKSSNPSSTAGRIAASPPPPVRGEPVTRLGIRLSYLNEFIEKTAGVRSNLLGLTFQDVNERFIKPMTLYHKSSLVEFMRLNRDPNIAVSNTYISHTWKDSFLETVEAIYHQCSVNHNDTVIWLDLFCINQHLVNAERPIEWWTTSLLPMIQQIGKTVLIFYPSEKPLALNRLWCLFEVYATIKGKGKVEIAMTLLDEQRFLHKIIEKREQFINDLFAIVDVEKAEAQRADEKTKMQDILRKDMGFSGTNNAIITEMRSLIVQLIDQRISTAGKQDDNSLMNLYYMSGLLHDVIGNLETAEKMLNAGMNQCKIVARDDSPTLPIYLACLAKIASIARKRQKYEDSEAYYKIALQKHQQVYGKNHLETLSVMSGYSLLYENQQKYNEAEKLGKECYEKQKQLLGENANETLITLNNLGFIYQKQGDYEKAVKAHEIFYQQMKMKYTDQHPTTLAAMHHLAMSYRFAGNIKQAEFYYQTVHQLKLQLYGPKHPETLLAMSNLALFYYDTQNYVDSNKLYQSVYQDFFQVFGENHPTTVIFLNNIGNLYNSCGEYIAAEKVFSLGYQKNKQLYGENHQNTIMSLVYLASVNDNMKRYLQAEKYYQLVYEKRKETLGETHLETLRAKEILENFYERQRTMKEKSSGSISLPSPEDKGLRTIDLEEKADKN